MRLHMSRKISGFRLCYAVAEDRAYRGLGRCTLDLLFQRLRLWRGETLLFELRQTNLLLQILAAIPILGLAVFVPFRLLFRGERIGRSRRLFDSAGYQITFGADAYDVHLHRDNRCSVVKNGTQICLVSKDEETWFEEHQYELLVSDASGEAELERLFLICMFIDANFFPNHRRWSAHRREKNVIFFDAFPERADWTP